MKQRHSIMLGLVLLVWLLAIHWDAYECWLNGGVPVPSLAHFACAAPR